MALQLSSAILVFLGIMVFSNTHLIALFLLIRTSVIALLHTITGGAEVASDIDFYRQMIESPMGILFGNQNQWVASYAPLQFVFTYPLHSFFSVFSNEFISYRLIMLTAETLSIFCLLKIVDKKNIGSSAANKSEFFLKLICILLPALILSSVVFVQDETICLMFMALSLLFISKNKNSIAVFFLCMGVLMGKIFLVVPLFYLIVFYDRSFKLWAISLIIPLVYSVVVYNAMQYGGHLPLVGFSPSAEYSSTFWALLLEHMPLQEQLIKRISLLTTIAIQLLLIGFLIYFHRRHTLRIPSEWYFSVPLLLFLLTLYQHNAEYILLVLPGLFLLQLNRLQIITLSGIFCFAWLPKILFGLSGINRGSQEASTFETRERVLGSIVSRLNFNIELAHEISIIVYSLSLLMLTIYVLRKSVLQLESEKS